MRVRSTAALHDTSSTRHQDGLRIIAAGAVVILHYSDYFKDAGVGRFLVAHTWHFNLFVDLFFVVSGFVIARQYFGRLNDAGSFGPFLWRPLPRSFRRIPPPFPSTWRSPGRCISARPGPTTPPVTRFPTCPRNSCCFTPS